MSKKMWVIALIMLVIGTFFGVTVYALATSAVSPVTMISKIWNGDEVQQPITPSSPATPLDPENLTSGETGTNPTSPEDDITDELTQSIISDYKLNVGTFFSAWKAEDMTSFRGKLGKAYTGEIYEKHAQRAEQYISQGIGLNVLEIVFDTIDIESASPNSATLKATYRYQAQDYMVHDDRPIGDIYEHEVKVKVNMVKIGSHWYITGESTVETED